MHAMSACDHRFCNTDRCFIEEREAANSRPTVSPPPSDELANDLVARARRLEKLSQQLAREANDLHHAAARIRKALDR